MTRFIKGMIIRTNYNTYPYVIEDVSGECTCPSFLDTLNYDSKRLEPPKSNPHCHMECHKVGDKHDKGYLGGYDENGNSVWCSDRIIVCCEETLFLTMCCGL